MLETRCRPRRVIKWGRHMDIIAIPCIKGIGIRIHSVEFERGEKDSQGKKHDEKKRRVVLKTLPNRRVYATKNKKPRLRLSAGGGEKGKDTETETEQEQEKGVCVCVFEHTIIARSADLQMGDLFTFTVVEKGDIEQASRPRAKCKLKVSQIWKELEGYNIQKQDQMEMLLSHRKRKDRKMSSSIDVNNSSFARKRRSDVEGVGVGDAEAEEEAEFAEAVASMNSSINTSTKSFILKPRACEHTLYIEKKKIKGNFVEIIGKNAVGNVVKGFENVGKGLGKELENFQADLNVAGEQIAKQLGPLGGGRNRLNSKELELERRAERKAKRRQGRVGKKMMQRKVEGFFDDDDSEDSGDEGAGGWGGGGSESEDEEIDEANVRKYGSIVLSFFPLEC